MSFVQNPNRDLQQGSDPGCSADRPGGHGAHGEDLDPEGSTGRSASSWEIGDGLQRAEDPNRDLRSGSDPGCRVDRPGGHGARGEDLDPDGDIPSLAQLYPSLTITKPN